MSEKETFLFVEKQHPVALRSEFQQRNYQIAKFSGKNCFVEIMNKDFHKNKVCLNFEQFDESKPKGQRTVNKVTIYMPFSKFRLLAQDILRDKIFKLAEKEKALGKSFPDAIYKDLTGTSAEQLANFKNSRPDGKSESRQFKILPAKKENHVMLQAESGMGEKSETGLIMPKYGTKPDQRVAVVVSYDDLKVLALETLAHIDAYLTSQYVDRTNSINIERATNSTNTQNNTQSSNQELNEKIDELKTLVIRLGKKVVQMCEENNTI